MQYQKNMKGFSLVEMMIAVTVIAIMATVAIPAYQDYMTAARVGVMGDNIQSIRLMQADRRADRGEYVEGIYDVSAGNTSLTTNLGWAPRTDLDVIDYEVACATDGGVAGECARNSGYTVTATHPDDGDATVSRTFDVGNNCTNC